MTCGLFSIFDPVTHLPLLGEKSLKWVLTIPVLLFIPWQSIALPASVGIIISNNIAESIRKITSDSNIKDTIVFMSVFTVILGINLSSLVPISFAPTAHPGFVLPFAVTLFLPSILGWLYLHGIRCFLSHLLPTGSPAPLWGFLVLVESVSVMIRPLTLTIRLVANIIAGHLFIDMLSSIILSSPFTISIGTAFMVGIVGFETAVSVVQAFVFTNLLIMFWEEQNDSH